jgi:hypothetical protein
LTAGAAIRERSLNEIAFQVQMHCHLFDRIDYDRKNSANIDRQERLQW